MKVWELFAAVPGGEMVFFNRYFRESECDCDRMCLEGIGCVTYYESREVKE